jgi:hypothetical protein
MRTPDVFNVSEQERQLIEVLREWASGDGVAYRLEISHADGAYEIKLSMPEQGKWARGVGSTLDQAWDNVAPGWA